MPPRLPIPYCLRTQNSPQCQTASRAFSSTPSSSASTVTQRRRHRDPYAVAQAKARKAANVSRQEVLKKERASSLGDPVRGITTPFVKSFDTALAPEPSPSTTSTKAPINQSPSADAPGPQTNTTEQLNFYLTKDEIEQSVQRSKWLSQPLKSDSEDEHAPGNAKTEPLDTSSSKQDRTLNSEDSVKDIVNSFSFVDPTQGRPDYAGSADSLSDLLTDSTPESRAQTLQERHDTASEAIRRISSLSLGSSKDRLRVNMQRCINVFGRHNTDHSLPAKLQSVAAGTQLVKDPRSGPDTGSSEVQIAILTAKIRSLADALELRGHPDKMNKRNLRLLVHRRAKLLKYLRRKERGGPRWQNLVETLGLTDATWKGEISL